MRIILAALLFIGAAFAQVSSVPGATGGGGGGTGTVTHTGGALTADKVIVGAGAADTAASNCTKTAGQPLTCEDGFSTGTGGAGLGIQLSGATSGLATIKPPAVAGTPTFTLPGTASDTLMGRLTPVLAAQTPWVNSGGFSIDSAVSGVITYSNVPAAQTDLYQSPASTRTLVGDCSAYNTSGSSSTLNFYIKAVGGAYWRISGSITVSAGANSSKAIGLILEPGENLATTPSVAGVNLWCKYMQFSSSEPFYTARMYNPSTGQNTFYTAPAGKVAITLAANAASNASISSGTLTAVNDSGGSRTYTAYMVPLAGSPGTGNQVSPGVAVANAAGGTIPATAQFSILNAGDFISVNVDAGTTTQWLYMNVMER